MDKTKQPENQPNVPNDNEFFQDQGSAVCSPEFPNGCTDVEPDETI